MRKGLKAFSTFAAAALIGVLAFNVKADDLDVQKDFVIQQINQGANADIKYEKLDAQKDVLINEINGYADKAHKDQQAHEALFEQQRINAIIADARNYASYLQARIPIVSEVANVKKAVLDNYTGLSVSNPQYTGLIPAASADYQKALMDQYNAQNAADAAKMFVNGPLIESYAKNALSWYQGPQDAGKFVMQSIGISTIY